MLKNTSIVRKVNYYFYTDHVLFGIFRYVNRTPVLLYQDQTCKQNMVLNSGFLTPINFGRGKWHEIKISLLNLYFVLRLVII